MKTWRFLALALLFTASFVSAADDDPTRPVSSAFVAPIGAAGIADAANYWTAEKIKSAIAYPMPQRPANLKAAVPAGINPAAAADFSYITPGGKPGDNFDQDSLTTQPLSITEVGTAGYSAPFPYTSYRVHSRVYKLYPHTTIGKVFFTLAGFDFVCSASSIGNRAVLTAGHCICDSGSGWATNWVFIPNYTGRYSKAKAWVAEELWGMSGWCDSGDFTYDVGFAVVAKKGRKTLSQKVGWLGMAWNFNAEHQHWHMFGYPVALENGNWLQHAQASFATWDTPGSGPATIGVGSNFTGGASGGPWILTYEPDSSGAKNYANGLNSYLYESYPGQIYSPYFGDAVHSLWETATAR